MVFVLVFVFVFVLFCTGFYSVCLNFSTAALVYGYSRALFGSHAALVFMSHVGNRERIAWLSGP